MYLGLRPGRAAAAAINNAEGEHIALGVGVTSLAFTKTFNMNQPNPDRLFIGVYPAGLVYADRHREENGDYAKLAFLPYDTLALELRPNCPPELKARIEADAVCMQGKRGQQYQISSSAQFVTLGKRS